MIGHDLDDAHARHHIQGVVVANPATFLGVPEPAIGVDAHFLNGRIVQQLTDGTAECGFHHVQQPAMTGRGSEGCAHKDIDKKFCALKLNKAYLIYQQPYAADVLMS
nr:hypothetical protein [Xanthomonas campestris]MDM7697661.1 hypothetical protein [Xanthomonas campestris pv. campestris]